MVALRESLREGIPWCWQELRAAEAVLDEVAEELGEDQARRLKELDEERVEFLRQRWLRQDA